MSEHTVSVQLHGIDGFRVYRDGGISAQRGLTSMHWIVDNWFQGWVTFPFTVVDAACWYWWGYR